MGFLDGDEDFFGLGALEQIAAGASPQGLKYPFRIFIDGQNDDM